MTELEKLMGKIIALYQQGMNNADKLQAIKKYFEVNNPLSASSQVRLLSILSEGIRNSSNTTLCWRKIAASVSELSNIDFSKPCVEVAADCFNISVEGTPDTGICVKFPALLPHKTHSTIDRTFFTPLLESLQKHNQECFRFKEKCVICVVQIYSSALPPRRIKDHDNLEFKCLVDCLARTYLVDDSPFYCDTFLSSRIGSSDFTEAYIIPVRLFCEWYSKVLNG